MALCAMAQEQKKKKRVRIEERGIPFKKLYDWFLDLRRPKGESLKGLREQVIMPEYVDKLDSSVAESPHFRDSLGPVKVFINHSWETPVADTFDGLKETFTREGWDLLDPLFLCAFVLHQGMVAEELGANFMKGPFIKVMNDMGKRGLRRNFVTFVGKDGHVFTRGFAVFEEVRAVKTGVDMILVAAGGPLGSPNVPPANYLALRDRISKFDVMNIECFEEADKRQLLSIFEQELSQVGGPDADWKLAVREAIRNRFALAWQSAESAFNNGRLDLMIERGDFTYTEPHIGMGRFGVVYKGTYADCPAAVKIIKLPTDKSRKDTIRKITEEANKLRSLRHPCVLSCFGVYISLKKLKAYIITELCEETLHEFLHGARYPLCAPTCLKICLDICTGLKEVHSKSFSHGDIKPENVLGDRKTNHWKLGDFGTAQVVGTLRVAQTVYYTPSYEAPEVANAAKDASFDGQKAPEVVKSAKDASFDGQKADMFSFSCVVFEVLTRRRPPTNKRCSPGLNRALEEVEEEIKFSFVGDEYGILRDIMRECSNAEPSLRPTSLFCRGQLNHSTSANIDQCGLLGIRVGEASNLGPESFSSTSDEELGGEDCMTGANVGTIETHATVGEPILRGIPTITPLAVFDSAPAFGDARSQFEAPVDANRDDELTENDPSEHPESEDSDASEGEDTDAREHVDASTRKCRIAKMIGGVSTLLAIVLLAVFLVIGFPQAPHVNPTIPPPPTPPPPPLATCASYPCPSNFRMRNPTSMLYTQDDCCEAASPTICNLSTAAGTNTIPHGKGSGIGCTNGVCFCVMDMIACTASCRDDTCANIYTARIKDGYCGCEEAGQPPAPAPLGSCTRKSAGQESVYIPYGTRKGSPVGQIDKNCYFCITNMTKCQARFGVTCQSVFKSRLKDGFCGCTKVGNATIALSEKRQRDAEFPHTQDAAQPDAKEALDDVEKEMAPLRGPLREEEEAEKMNQEEQELQAHENLGNGEQASEKEGEEEKRRQEPHAHEEPRNGEEPSNLRNLKWRWAEHKIIGMTIPKFQFENKWNMPADRAALVKELEEKKRDPQAVAKKYKTRSVEFADVDYPEWRMTFADLSKAMDWLTLGRDDL